MPDKEDSNKVSLAHLGHAAWFIVAIVGSLWVFYSTCGLAARPTVHAGSFNFEILSENHHIKSQV